VLALVMPLSLVSGDAWKKSRALLAKNYRDIVVVSIAGSKDLDNSFSADTGSGECLVVGRKAKPDTGRATFAILNERPPNQIAGAQAAYQIRRLIDGGQIRRLEDGPAGGTPINFGDEVIGHLLDAPLPESTGWFLSRVMDLSLAQTAYQIVVKGKVWLPAMRGSDAPPIPITTIKAIGQICPYHSDVKGINADGSVRGPFKIQRVTPSAAPTYPVLWSHSADRERTTTFEPDSEGLP
jgi:hypothetical protein